MLKALTWGSFPLCPKHLKYSRQSQIYKSQVQRSPFSPPLICTDSRLFSPHWFWRWLNCVHHWWVFGSLFILVGLICLGSLVHCLVSELRLFNLISNQKLRNLKNSLIWHIIVSYRITQFKIIFIYLGKQSLSHLYQTPCNVIFKVHVSGSFYIHVKKQETVGKWFL